MTFDLIISGTLLLVGVLCFFSAIFSGEGGWAVAMFFLTVFCGVVHFEMADANKKGNREMATYSFPSQTYKMELVVNDKTTKVLVDGVETEMTERDTIYVLKGIEPVFPHDSDKEDMRLKTVVREKLDLRGGKTVDRP